MFRDSTIIRFLIILSCLLCLAVILHDRNKHKRFRDVLFDVLKAVAIPWIIYSITFFSFGWEHPVFPKPFGALAPQPPIDAAPPAPVAPVQPRHDISVPGLDASFVAPSLEPTRSSCSPVRMTVLVDVSGSSRWSSPAASLYGLLEPVFTCGGHLRFGLIGGGWKEQFIELDIPSPPKAHDRAAIDAAELTDGMKRRKHLVADEEDRAERLEWAIAAQKEAKLFWPTIDQLIATRVNPDRSPVCEMADYADETFLHDASAGMRGTYWTILLSDGDDVTDSIPRNQRCPRRKSCSHVMLVHPFHGSVDADTTVTVHTLSDGIEYMLRNSRQPSPCPTVPVSVYRR